MPASHHSRVGPGAHATSHFPPQEAAGTGGDGQGSGTNSDRMRQNRIHFHDNGVRVSSCPGRMRATQTTSSTAFLIAPWERNDTPLSLSGTLRRLSGESEFLERNKRWGCPMSWRRPPTRKGVIRSTTQVTRWRASQAARQAHTKGEPGIVPFVSSQHRDLDLQEAPAGVPGWVIPWLFPPFGEPSRCSHQDLGKSSRVPSTGQVAT